MEKTIGVTLKKYAILEFLNSLANCLLIIDDSCEEIHNDKEFVKLTIAGRHKNINVIHIVQIKQVKFLGKQLNLVNLLKDCFQLATKEPFGNLLIDLDPKTSDCLR